MNKYKKIGLLLITIFLVISLLYSVYNIIKYYKDTNEINKEIKEINEIIKPEYKEDSENVEIFGSEEVSEFDPYWDYIKYRMIDVDFNTLLKQNKDTSGWLNLPGTNINYPYVHTKNNDYYLMHSFNKKPNQGGWPFLDYRNSTKEWQRNNIIYGHSLTTGASFGTLKKVLSDEWLNNTSYHVIKIAKENESSIWQIFSVYKIDKTSDYIKTDFKDDNEFKEFENMILERSIHNFNTTLNEQDKILTLSSCYINDNYRLVVHAKLIKKDNNNI